MSMKSLPTLAFLTVFILVAAPVRAEEAPSYTLRTRVIPNDLVAPLQRGADGTLYNVRFDLAQGREYWSSPYPRHPNYGKQYFYVLDRQGHRLSQNLYLELPNGRLQLASTVGEPEI